MTVPLLTTKLYIPAPRPNLVARPKLLAQLDDGLRLGRKLSLVCAPAGFGKTTLVSAWVHDVRQRMPVAWLSIDEEDNDSQRFAVYIVSALRALLSESDAKSFGARFLTEIHTPHHIPNDVMAQVREQVAILLNDIAALPEKLVLVLDDYHLLNDPRIEEGMTFLLAHLPPQIHLVITSRVMPPLPIARLRARGQLTELNADHLRFSADETIAFLTHTMDLQLPAEHIAQLEARTEGWAAGLQMAALSILGQSDTAEFIQNFAGDDRYILDYLLEEVLRHQPDAVQDFMLRTSILERMSGPLCDALLGNGAGEQKRKANIPSTFVSDTSSQATLEYLERTNLFIVPLDNKRQWYRYHQLFGELLRHRLQQRVGDDGVRVLHRRVAEWFVQTARSVDADFPTEAIPHLLQAQEFEQVAHYIEMRAEGMLKRNEVLALQGWLRVLPQPVLHAHPFLCLTYAWTLLAQAQFDEAAQWVDTAERVLGLHNTASPSPQVDKSLLGHIAALRVTIDSNRNDDAALIVLAHQALDNLSSDDALLRSVIAESLGDVHLRNGDMVAARCAFNDAISTVQGQGNIIVTLAAIGGLGISYEHVGDLHRAADIYREAIALGTASGSGGQPVPATGLVHMHLARALYEWDQLGAALTHIQQGIAGCERWGHTTNLLDSYRWLTLIYDALGDTAGVQTAVAIAQKVLAEAQQRAQQWGRSKVNMDWETYHLGTLQAHLHLRAGHLDIAANKIAHLVRQREMTDDAPLHFLLRPRLFIAQGNPGAALDMLDSAYQRAQVSGSVRWQIEILSAQACALYLQGAVSRAIATLERALVMGKSGNYIRTFVDNDLPMDMLLDEAIARDVEPDYVGRILAAFDKPFTKQPVTLLVVDALSEREIEVLRLIAADLSNKDIADALFVSVNTVKTHIKRLYAKLHVNSRVQALSRARELDFLK